MAGRRSHIDPIALDPLTHMFPVTLHAEFDLDDVRVTCTNMAGDTFAESRHCREDCVKDLRAKVIEQMDISRRNVTFLLEDGTQIDKAEANTPLIDIYALNIDILARQRRALEECCPLSCAAKRKYSIT